MSKLMLALLLLVPSVAFADQYVQGYTRRDGTYVEPYFRSSPNQTVQDNYSYKGNQNPYTQTTGDNYYRHNTSSQYYGSSGSYSQQQYDYSHSYRGKVGGGF